MFLTLYFLLFAEGFGRTQIRTEYTYNLELFKEINRFLEWSKESQTGYKMMLMNVFGNVICFVPFGFFLPIAAKKMKNALYVILAAFIFSLMVEMMQLVFKIGSFDVDDLLLNTIGGLTGYILYFVTRCIVKYSEQKKRKKG